MAILELRTEENEEELIEEGEEFWEEDIEGFHEEEDEEGIGEEETGEDMEEVEEELEEEETEEEI